MLIEKEKYEQGRLPLCILLSLGEQLRRLPRATHWLKPQHGTMLGESFLAECNDDRPWSHFH